MVYLYSFCYPFTNFISSLSPSKESITKLIQDFSQKPPRYGCCYLHFTSALTKELFDELKGSPVVPYLRDMKENNIDFLAYESYVFHFDSRESIMLYFCEELSEYRDPYQKEIAEKLAGVCGVLETKPKVIRYMNSVSKLAEICKREIGSLPLLPDPKCKLLLLDRSFDMVSPLLHEFTYQAMFQDILDDVIIEDEFKNYYTDFNGEKKERIALLDDTDPIYRQIKHKHIGDTLTWLNEKVREFVKNNDIRIDDKSTDLSKLMREIPKYQELGSKYSIHTDISRLLAEKPKKCKLIEIARLEQDIATGLDNLGRTWKPASVYQESKQLVTDNRVQQIDALRLVALLATSKEYKMNEIEELAKLANLSDEEMKAVRNIRNLVPREKAKFFSSLSKKKKKIQEDAYETSRWIPILKNIVESLSNNKLQEDKYPKLVTSETDNEKKPNWANSDSTGHSKSSSNNKASTRIIVFVLGGITFSEMRSMYELMSANRKVEIIIGSTHLIKPNEFVMDFQF